MILEVTNMRTESTELVFILDKSGSMSGLESDTIGGFNAMLAKQKRLDGDCRVTTVLFDHEYSLLHDRADVQAVTPITEREYAVGGSTALLDAVGRTINKIDNALRNTAVEYRPDKVVFVIITDGAENASVEYNLRQVRQMIRRQSEGGNWNFLFLGANIDAVEAAASIGIEAKRAANFRADSAGVKKNFNVLDEVICSFRNCKSMPYDWKERIEGD